MANETADKALAWDCARHLFDRDQASRALGMEIIDMGPGFARLTMAVREDMVNGHAIAHGGLIFSLADSAFAFACNSYDRNTVAQGCSIDFVRPGKLGERLEAVAEERARGGRTGVYDVTVFGAEQQVVAYFRGKCYEIRGRVLPPGGAGQV
ncbi:hydroxyphenylacetyl-CoA thioesterase PaaI [Exilibacterium tricleocarpae]|uniref:Hydroxyphenylacetyl-CoA thioesterase PaaI n=1 Tax=Exilibacterium tricleocarpae TaxID=2591008 RepID=A0A545SP22_9GAMM|nr:hydroxyphenylacetyl-CoA thioesterase PaaI [Exilibacterium tricleocarpae]TQV66728.1 hydroxyphenylacetyl-CoA thioesterase PaaI [Exilibacterium tricleocarpae]